MPLCYQINEIKLKKKGMPWRYPTKSTKIPKSKETIGHKAFNIYFTKT